MADTSRLPGPQLDYWDWQLSAACRGMDIATFFHPPDERNAARANRIEQPKAICRRGSPTGSGADCPRTSGQLNWGLRPCDIQRVSSKVQAHPERRMRPGPVIATRYSHGYVPRARCRHPSRRQ